MVGIFEKARVITAAAIHSLLDRPWESMSIPILDQYLRELEDAVKDTQAALAEARYDLTQKVAAAAAIQEQINHHENDARLLMDDPTPERRAAALRLAHEVTQLRPQVGPANEAAEAQREDVAKLEAAVESMQKRLDAGVKQRAALRTKEKSSRVKEKATRAIEAAGVAADAVASVDGLSDRIGRRSAVADDAFDRAVGAAAGGSDPALAQAEAEAELAAMLGKKTKV